jgi:hypothetical protein
MKNIIILLLVVSAFATFTACTKNDVILGENQVLPTFDNMSSIWVATDYKKNGQSMAKSFYESDYIMINTDKTFSTRDSLINDGYYYFGTCNFSGKRVNFNSTIGSNFYKNISSILDNSIVIKDTINNIPYQCTYTKSSIRTTYQVSNKMTSYSLYIYSYFYENSKIKDYCYHGYITNGITASDKTFTKRSMINLAVKLSTTLYICVYPKAIISGTNNLLIISDTTKVINTSSNIKSYYIKSKLENKSMTLKEALSND